LLIASSGLGSFILLVVPTYVIGLLGRVPIGIGIKNLIELRKKENNNLPYSKHVGQKKNKSYLSFLTVATVHSRTEALP
jgi:cadmium resistance protein CadD (predicted permease)